MKTRSFICLLVVLLFSCKKRTELPKVLLDCSFYGTWSETSSIKIYNNGKAFLKEGGFSRDSFYLKEYIKVDSLIGFIAKAEKMNIKNNYVDSLVSDATNVNLVIYYSNGKFSKHYIYGINPPEILRQILGYPYMLSRSSGWIKLKDTIIHFSSSSYYPKPNIKQVTFPPPVDK